MTSASMPSVSRSITVVAYLVVLIVVIAGLGIYSLNHERWAIRDEFYHADVIRKFASGYWPSPIEPASPALIIDSYHKNWNHRPSLAKVGDALVWPTVGYMAQQSPLYYLILALPASIWNDRWNDNTIILLRLVSIALVVAGMMAAQHALREDSNSALAAILALGTQWETYATLHNDSLSPLVVGIALVGLFDRDERRGLMLLHLGIGLSLVSKLTNAIAVVPLFAAAWMRWRRGLFTSPYSWTCYLPFAGWLAWNAARFGIAGILGHPNGAFLITHDEPSGPLAHILILVGTSVSTPNLAISTFLFFPVLIGLIMRGAQVERAWRQGERDLIVWLPIATVTWVMAATMLLNHLEPRMHASLYRHACGISILWHLAWIQGWAGLARRSSET